MGWVVVYACACVGVCVGVRTCVSVYLSICPPVRLCPSARARLWIEGGGGKGGKGVGSETNRTLFPDEGLHSSLLLEIELLHAASSVEGKVERQDVVRVVIIKELGRVRGSIQKGGENGYQGK